MEFQDVILNVSYALKDQTGYDLSAEEVAVLMEGFASMARTVNNAQLTVEKTEAQLYHTKKKKLWHPGE